MTFAGSMQPFRDRGHSLVRVPDMDRPRATPDPDDRIKIAEINDATVFCATPADSTRLDIDACVSVDGKGYAYVIHVDFAQGLFVVSMTRRGPAGVPPAWAPGDLMRVGVEPR